MFKYSINILIFLVSFCGLSQTNKTKDSVEYKQKYGIRLGVDLSRIVLSVIDDDYNGIELAGDYRLKENLFIAGELGDETRTDTEGIGSSALYNYTASGNYLKLGVDYNTYNNWFGEQNFITIGGRFAYSSFSQTLNSFSIFNSNRFFNEDFIDIATSPQEFDGRTATWLEFVAGFKTEIFTNIYMGATLRIGFLITESEEEQFSNLWIPGFNNVNDNSRFGIGYNYTISYFLPLYKKAKKKRENQNKPKQ